MKLVKKLDYAVLALGVIVIIGLIGLVYYFAQGKSIAVLQPKGQIASKQLSLLATSLKLSALVVLPVFAMVGWVVFRYRERGNQTSKNYSANWDRDSRLEILLWGLPTLIITILSVVTWKSTHQLDPYRPIDSNVQAVKIQVVALEWKWLFIYPDYGVASVNEMHLPEDTPVSLEITSDAPMNAFWVPQLGGQVYAMSGMSSKLHLVADEPGQYRGVSANLSGKGFADMNFMAISTNRQSFDDWVDSVRVSERYLNTESFNVLAQPGSSDVASFALLDNNLYDKVVNKYGFSDNSRGGYMHGGTHE